MNMICVDSILKNTDDFTNLIDLCRLCGNFRKSAIPLFDDTRRFKYWEMINLYFEDIQVSRSDILPLNICSDCVSSITSWNLFYSNCMKVNEKFKAIVEKYNLSANGKKKIKISGSVSNNVEVIELDVEDEVFDESEIPLYDIEFKDPPIIREHYTDDNDSINVFEEKIFVEPLAENLHDVHKVKKEISVNKTDVIQKIIDWDGESSKSTKCNICGSVFMKNKIDNANNRGICYSCYKKLKYGRGKHKNTFATFNRYLVVDENRQAYFQCDLCSFSCDPFPDIFTHHYGTEHPKAELFLCYNNDRTSKIKDTLGKYLKEGRQGVVYQCDKCDFECKPVREVFMKHYNTHEGMLELRIPPSENHTKFTDAIALKDSKFLCTICNKSYESLAYARRHLRRVHREKLFHCQICGKGFTFKHKAKMHQKRHLKERSFMCDVCGKRFVAKCNLEMHMKKKLCSKYICFWCDKPFYKKTLLKSHLIVCEKQSHEFSNEEEVRMVCDGKNISKYECAVCPKKFISKAALEIHIIAENKLTPFKCDSCDAKYSNRKLLKNHMKVCAQKSPKKTTKGFKINDKEYFVTINENNTYSCTICDKKCRRLEYLKQHLRSHSGVKPYVCQFCGKAYTFKSSLTSHMLTEMNLRKFVCSVCGKRYNASSHLTAHIKKHHRLRDYKCSACDKEFAYLRDLNEHMRSHNEAKQFFCDKCGGFFKTERYLKVHWERCSVLKKS